MTPAKHLDWRPRIGLLIKIHQEIRHLDTSKVWKHELPRIPATPEQLRDVENAVGPLDPLQRSFLLCADGWERFYQWVDLFGTPDLVGGPMERALDRTNELENVLGNEGVLPGTTLPIAMSGPGTATEDPDLFLVVRMPTRSPGRVLWLASDVIDTFNDFEEFFASMTEYNRLEANDLARMSQ